MSDSEYVLYSQSEAREAEIWSGMEMMREGRIYVASMSVRSRR